MAVVLSSASPCAIVIDRTAPLRSHACGKCSLAPAPFATAGLTGDNVTTRSVDSIRGTRFPPPRTIPPSPCLTRARPAPLARRTARPAWRACNEGQSLLRYRLESRIGSRPCAAPCREQGTEHTPARFASSPLQLHSTSPHLRMLHLQPSLAVARGVKPHATSALVPIHSPCHRGARGLPESWEGLPSRLLRFLSRWPHSCSRLPSTRTHYSATGAERGNATEVNNQRTISPVGSTS